MIVKFTYRPNPAEVNGFFDEDDPDNIYINSELSPGVRTFVIAHETQHQECFQNKCCCQDNEFLAEYHAFRAEFEHAKYLDSDFFWETYFESFLDDLKKFQRHWKNGGRIHVLALKKLWKTKEFQRRVEQYPRLHKEIHKELMSEKRK